MASLVFFKIFNPLDLLGHSMDQLTDQRLLNDFTVFLKIGAIAGKR